jgi:hypothetical protein
VSKKSGPDPFTPWVDHVYASLHWSEGSIRRLHELLEVETVSDDLRGRAARAVSFLETARKEAFFAFEKMGGLGSGDEQMKQDVSSIGDETKVRMLRLNAEFIEASVDSTEGRMSYESLRGVMLSVVQTLRHQASEIDEARKRSLEGPSGA